MLNIYNTNQLPTFYYTGNRFWKTNTEWILTTSHKKVVWKYTSKKTVYLNESLSKVPKNWAIFVTFPIVGDQVLPTVPRFLPAFYLVGILFDNEEEPIRYADYAFYLMLKLIFYC